MKNERKLKVIVLCLASLAIAGDGSAMNHICRNSKADASIENSPLMSDRTESFPQQDETSVSASVPDRRPKSWPPVKKAAPLKSSSFQSFSTLGSKEVQDELDETAEIEDERGTKVTRAAFGTEVWRLEHPDSLDEATWARTSLGSRGSRLDMVALPDERILLIKAMTAGQILKNIGFAAFGSPIIITPTYVQIPETGKVFQIDNPELVPVLNDKVPMGFGSRQKGADILTVQPFVLGTIGKELYPQLVAEAERPEFFRQMGITLKSIHELGIEHDDFNPGNWFYDIADHKISIIDWADPAVGPDGNGLMHGMLDHFLLWMTSIVMPFADYERFVDLFLTAYTESSQSKIRPAAGFGFSAYFSKDQDEVRDWIDECFHGIDSKGTPKEVELFLEHIGRYFEGQRLNHKHQRHAKPVRDAEQLRHRPDHRV
jgi:hypothetical protein